MRTVVVTGASGFLGRRVVNLLSGHPDLGRLVLVDLVSTGAPSGAEVKVLDLSTVPGTGADPLGDAMVGADSVIHLAWSLTGPNQGEEDVSLPSNLVALRHLLAVSARCGITNLVHLSSATVYGAWPDNQVPLTESSAIRPNPGFAFAIQKAESERLVAEWTEDRLGVATAVLRPAVTVGSDGPALYRALGGTGGPASLGAARQLQFLHVDDLARAVVLAWEKRVSGVYNVAPDHGVSEEVARSLVGGIARLRLPAILARFVSSATWRLWRSGTPRTALAYATNPWVVAADKLQGLGWIPEHSSEEALVAADRRSHLGDLSPSRRQQVMLAIAGLGLVVGGVTVFGAVLFLRARRRRPGAPGRLSALGRRSLGRRALGRRALARRALAEDGLGV